MLKIEDIQKEALKIWPTIENNSEREYDCFIQGATWVYHQMVKEREAFAVWISVNMWEYDKRDGIWGNAYGEGGTPQYASNQELFNLFLQSELKKEKDGK